MKIIINESKLIDVATKYASKQLGEFKRIKNKSFDGAFFKDGKFVAGTWRSDLYPNESLHGNIINMFDLSWRESAAIIKKAASIISGRDFILFFPSDHYTLDNYEEDEDNIV
jgi:hypothetical protein